MGGKKIQTVKGLDNLTRLVKSLDEREKRAVIGHFNGRSGKEDRLYLKLFRLLDSIETSEYSGKAVEKAMGISGRKLATTRYYLQQVILSALRHTYDSESIESKLWNAITDTEILLNKGLSVMAHKRLRAVQKLCSEYPHPYFIVRYQRLRAALDQPSNTKEQDDLSEIHAFSSLVHESATRLGGHELCLMVIQHSSNNLRNGLIPDMRLLEHAARQLDASDSGTDSVTRMLSATLSLLKGLTSGARDTDMTRFCELLRLSMADAPQNPGHATIAEGLYWVGDRFIGDFQSQALHRLLEVLSHRPKWDPGNAVFKVVHHTLSSRVADSRLIPSETDTRQDHWTPLDELLSNKRIARKIPKSIRFESTFWLASQAVSRGGYVQAVDRLRLLLDQPWPPTSSEELQVASRLLHLISIFELGHFNEVGRESRDLVLFIHTCKGLFAHELNFINNMRRVRIFDSMKAETQFYLEVLNRVQSIPCENRYLLLNDAVVTTHWLTSRLPPPG
jgi:hypothetical protein